MPASSGVGIVGGHIESSLRASLGGSNSSSLDQKLVSSSKRVLLHNIDFEAAENDSSFQLDSLRSKYKPLNPSKTVLSSEHQNNQMAPTSNNIKSEHHLMNGHAQKTKSSSEYNDGIPKPSVVLFPPEKVQLEWKQARGAAVGLRNNNNNCYLNSVLQCLTYTAPLVNYLYSNDHTYKCKQPGFCMTCELQRHIKRCLEQPRIPNRDCTISPQSILGKIKMIAKHLAYGRQEDAHEFLRYVVEGMQKSSLHGYPEKLDRFSKDTTVVSQIFGGYLRSQVMCLKCKERSNTYDPLLDISLDIKNVGTLVRAFERFVHPETLDNDNAYNCQRCKTKVPAQKRFTIHRAPNILTVQLKRFDYNRMTGGKVTRQVIYPEKLDLRPYMSVSQGPAVLYQLYAVLTHVGHSAGSGHYFCNVRAPNRQWFTMNDQHVTPIALQRVLSTEAYLLFYSRVKPKVNQYDAQKPMIGPKLPPGHKLQTLDKAKSSISEPSNDVGSPIVRRENGKPAGILKSSSNFPGMRQAGDGPHTSTPIPTPKPTAIPLPAQRDKVSFGIVKPKPTESTSSEKTPPRIVMHIKNGKVFFPGDGKGEAGKQKVNGTDGKAKLVPYNDDSSNSEEEETLVIRPPVPNNHAVGSKEKGKMNGNVGVVFDKRLNATTVVPGSYKPLDTGDQPETPSQKPRESSPIKHSAGSRFTSPLCRSVSDSLSVVTNSGSQHRVNATTSWHVLDQEAAISPSLASGSSNTSMNSTTEWQVTPGAEKRTKPVLPDAKCNGWTVTPVKESKNGKTSGSDHEENKDGGPPNEDSLSTKPHKELNITIKKQPHNGGWESKPKNTDLYMSDLPEDVKPMKNASSPKDSSHNTNGTIPASPEKDVGHTNSSTHLLNGHAETNGSHDSAAEHKKHKKHKKHKRERSDDEDDDEGQVNGCGASDLLNMIKKKKKKRKHKHRHDDREPLLSTSDSDSSRKDSKRSSSSDDTDDSRLKNKGSKEADEDPYIWVEKTRETMDKEKAKKKEAPAQSWDHYVKDGYKRRSEDDSVKTKTPWDGTRSKSDTVLTQLKKMSARGYGNQVSSWEGGKSMVDHDVDRDRRHERKRHWADDYEDELDKGRTKKAKSYSDGSFGNRPSYSHGNPFQKMQDMRSVDRDRQRPSGKYGDRNDRPHYSSHYQHSYGGHRDNNYRDNGHRDNGHRDGYHSHGSYYNSYRGGGGGGGGGGGYRGNKRRDRYY